MRNHLPGAIAVALCLGCTADLNLPPAEEPILGQVIILNAMSDTTDPAAASGYSLMLFAGFPVGTSDHFDFAFDVRDTLGGTQAYLIPRGNLGLPPDGGLQASLSPFDDIVLAPEQDYETTGLTPIVPGSVVLAASRRQDCVGGSTSPRYAKVNVESVNLISRQVLLHIVVNPNCGYRNLDGVQFEPSPRN